MAKPPPDPHVPDPATTLREMSQQQFAEELRRIHSALDQANGGGKSRIRMDPPRGIWDPEKGVWRYGTDLEVPDPSWVPHDAPTPEPPPEPAVGEPKPPAFDFPDAPPEPPRDEVQAPARVPQLLLLLVWGLASAILGALFVRFVG